MTDPTLPIREKAASYPEVARGTSCNQSSFKAGGGTFLFIGPGPKGKGYKAMFKLRDSMSDAEARAESEPARFEVGKTGWVTARFTAEEPPPRTACEPPLDDPYPITTRNP